MAMRQLGERNVDRPINHLLWSPKMDILAVTNESNEVSLFRLNWQKVCSILLNEIPCQIIAIDPVL